MIRLCVSACAAAAFALPSLASAQSAALALRAGTLGPSIGVTVGAFEKVNLRVDVPKFSYDYTGTYQQDDFTLAYTAEMELFSVSGLIDVHPFGNGFRLVAGGVLNRNKANLIASSAESHTVGNRTYTKEEIGQLNTQIEPGSEIAPYVGIGFGNAVSANKRLGFTFDVGVLMQGSPKVTMTGNGMIEPTAENAPQVQENLEWAKYYPGLSIDITYRIF